MGAADEVRQGQPLAHLEFLICDCVPSRAVTRDPPTPGDAAEIYYMVYVLRAGDVPTTGTSILFV